MINLNNKEIFFKNFPSKIFLSHFFCVLFLFSSFCLAEVERQNIREILSTIPEEDKEALYKLFYNLFNRNNFSYTLFGDKPMSLAAYFTSLFDDDGMPLNKEIKFWNQWKIWKKYEKLFSFTHYFLIEGPDEKKAQEIYFINKKYFIDKINQNLHLFQECLGENITGASFLKKIEDNPRIFSLFNHHPLLLGILLDYGVHNAKLFNERNRLSPFVYRKTLPEIPLDIPNPSEGFSSLQEEFSSYFSVLTLFGDSKYSPLILHSVHFVADHNHPETIELQKKYRKMRGEISAIYSKGDFLEITLSKLTEK